MERFTTTHSPKSRVKRIIDHNPKDIWNNEVCVMYGEYSITAQEVANSLNMAYELRQLSPSATKKQMQEIINKYR
ncbi:MAG: hypothetical protein A2W90_18175 [Bacteroidetes bacterium GWF2_42_66]|nr:MAG: hypothetical protein A2W92_06165 [Bacteroidetes bacterium GWA2_42_15]OFX98180.1 MAG: hypothetical protein A2W89_09665 [Bacteroidetes bacterium GWE2_42_39]OFY42565.1 MAG: hypothetical protein A2W90_18175 [Bacteroidetes bacterium GWF2_42_66]HBL74281.1 hypothetical protein [Prolixibacteraceae bacterium]HCR92248.1 hypothetical protein [Prolixibacteraceae bacterium]